MKVQYLYKLVALVLATSILVACQSTPEDTGDAATDTSGVDSADTTSIGTGYDDSLSSSDLGGIDGATLEAVKTAATTFYFDFDQSSLMSSDRDALQLHASFLASNSAASVRLEGYADERGTREYNIALGERRGNAVMKFLVVNGVGADQIEVVSYGEENPADPGHNETAWAKNRRVELSYSAGQP